MLAAMFAAFLIQIAFRYLAGFPTGWTHELSVMLWIWLVLWGAAFVVSEREEIRFEKGQMQTSAFSDYKVPRFADQPAIDVHVSQRASGIARCEYWIGRP